MLYSTVSVQQTSLSPANASQNDAIFSQHIRATLQCLSSYGCAITIVYKICIYTYTVCKYNYVVQHNHSITWRSDTRSYMCMYIRICVCVYVYVYVYTYYVYVYTYMCMYIHIMCMYIPICVCMYLYVYVYAYICMRIRIYVCVANMTSVFGNLQPLHVEM